MSWVEELRKAFERLQTGQRPQVGFASRTDRVGEVGQEFNALARDLAASPNGLTRTQAHSLRNRLAGILASLHLLRESEELSEEEHSLLGEILAHAQRLEARLRVARE
ncbi:MAG: hypothetical protein HY653_06595 [Acidobacteria bacterium]|nr:hypothetical protein [Acidobacteriota bacterium]